MKVFIFFTLVCIACLFISCENNASSSVVVNFADTLGLTPELGNKKSRPIYIAIASMTSPRETFTYYSQLIDYISDELGQTVLIKQKKTYEEVNDLLKRGTVDFAFICSGAYVGLSENNDVDLLVTPVVNGRTSYQAYIIAKNEPSFNSFEDLKDQRFAFTDPLSNTGYVYPHKLLKELNTHERIFFSKTIYTYGHDISIQMVNRGVLDGASVHGLIYEYIKELHPERVENIRVLKKSEWFAMPPIVTPKQLQKERFQKYKTLFSNIHKDSLGKAILDKLRIEKFVSVEDSIYKNVRKLKDYVEGKSH